MFKPVFVEHSSSEIEDTEMFCATPSFPRRKTTGRTCPLNIYSVLNNFSQSDLIIFCFFSPTPSDVETLVGRGSAGHTCPEKREIISSDKSVIKVYKKIVGMKLL